jgi:solute:Na+ symporter, SSS family
VIAWIALGWSGSFLGGPGIYEIIPGFILSMTAIVVVSLATAAKGEFRPLAAE